MSPAKRGAKTTKKKPPKRREKLKSDARWGEPIVLALPEEAVAHGKTAPTDNFEMFHHPRLPEGLHVEINRDDRHLVRFHDERGPLRFSESPEGAHESGDPATVAFKVRHGPIEVTRSDGTEFRLDLTRGRVVVRPGKKTRAPTTPRQGVTWRVPPLKDTVLDASILAMLGEAPLPSWARELLDAASRRPSTWRLACACGVVAAYAGARSQVETADDLAPALEVSALRWARSWPPQTVDAVVELAIAEVDLLLRQAHDVRRALDALDPFDDVYEDQGAWNDALSELLRLCERRDDLHVVGRLLDEAATSARLRAAFGPLDRAGEELVAGLVDPLRAELRSRAPRIADVASSDPEAWWSLSDVDSEPV